MSPELYAMTAYLIRALPRYASHKKLSVLLYHVQAQHLTSWGAPAFREPLYAAAWGPEVRALKTLPWRTPYAKNP